MEARKAFEEEKKPSEGALKVTLIKRKGRVIGLSPVQDYVYRAPDSELEYINLYEWIRSYKKEKSCPKKLGKRSQTLNKRMTRFLKQTTA